MIETTVYCGYVIFQGVNGRVTVSVQRTDGYADQTREFATVADAKAWVDFIESF